MEASKLKASMSLPLWSTNNSFGTERTKDLGTFGIMDVTGSYLFFAETDPDHVETLTIDLLVSSALFFVCLLWSEQKSSAEERGERRDFEKLIVLVFFCSFFCS